mgnify:CR=1 FL=1
MGYGPTGERVRTRLVELRTERNITLRELSARLAELGRPILANGISKIEMGERRVDVDDLMALAIALDVTPNALLLPAEHDEHADVALTSGTALPAGEAWRWAAGEQPPSGQPQLNQARQARLLVKSDTTVIPQTRGLFIGDAAACNIALLFVADSAAVTFARSPGTPLPS